jgi:dTDP-4-amino-4,6-dideoxygalactose transaminase
MNDDKKLKKPVYVTQPYMPPLAEFMPYLEEIWDKKWLTNMGKFHQEFEQALCDYLGIKYISLFTNGTLALITALQVLRITGEVITTPFSFVATTHALHWNGIKPVFCDIEPRTFNLDPEKIEAAITPKTTAILPVHVYGNPCAVDRIAEIADTYGLKVIYDACHTFGVRINGNSLLNFGDLSVLSFHATKVFHTFEGGAIVCHDEKTKKRIDYLKNFGFANETTVIGVGINAKMNEFQSAFGLLQLKYVNRAIEKRGQLTDLYRQKLKNVPGVRTMPDSDGVNNNYQYFPVLIDQQEYGRCRDDIYDELKKQNIFARRYFYPLISQFPTYRGLLSSSPDNLPVAEQVAQGILCLPLYSELEISVIDKICTTIEGLAV